MKLSITIEVNDAAPTVELCGEKCRFLGKGYCSLFQEKLETHGNNQFKDLLKKLLNMKKQ